MESVDCTNHKLPALGGIYDAVGMAAPARVFGNRLVFAVKYSIAAWKLAIECKIPVLKHCYESLAKKPSTAISQRDESGTKWNVKRGVEEPHFSTGNVCSQQSVRG